jgi:outer membrane protein assembly factor BamE (lipoprotein component of BamABCDE complex)
MSNRILLAAVAALSLTACAGLSPSGYAPTMYTSIHTAAFTGLKPGVTTKEDVRKQVGIPLTESHFPRLNEDVWEYRYLDGTTIVMLAYVHFDPNGVLKYYEQRLDPAFTGGIDSM